MSPCCSIAACATGSSWHWQAAAAAHKGGGAPLDQLLNVPKPARRQRTATRRRAQWWRQLGGHAAGRRGGGKQLHTARCILHHPCRPLGHVWPGLLFEEWEQLAVHQLRRDVLNHNLAPALGRRASGGAGAGASAALPASALPGLLPAHAGPAAAALAAPVPAPLDVVAAALPAVLPGSKPSLCGPRLQLRLHIPKLSLQGTHAVTSIGSCCGKSAVASVVDAPPAVAAGAACKRPGVTSRLWRLGCMSWRAHSGWGRI